MLLMETTEHVFKKADEMNKCLQKVAIEYQRRITNQTLDFQITALSIEHNNKILLAGDSNGIMYRAEIKELRTECKGFKMQDLGEVHSGAILTICPLNSNEFLTGGSDGKLILWRDNSVFEVTNFDYHIISLISYSDRVWIFGNTNIAVQYKLCESGLRKKRLYTLRTESPKNLQYMSSIGSFSILYSTKNSIDIWSTMGEFVTDSHAVNEVITFCILKETNGLAISVKRRGIYIWYYESVTGKYYEESEGKWDYLLSLDNKILVSIGSLDKNELVKFWSEKERMCIFEILLDSAVIAVALSQNEHYLLLSLKDKAIKKIKLKKKFIEKNISSEFLICDIAVGNTGIFIAGGKELSFQNQLVTLAGPVTSCKVWKNMLLLAESTQIKLFKNSENLKECQVIIENKFPIQLIELINDDNWVIIIEYHGHNSKIIIYDLQENDIVYYSEIIPDIVFKAGYIRGYLIYSTDKLLHFIELPKIERGYLYYKSEEKPSFIGKTFAKKELRFFSNREENLLFCAGKNGIIDIVELRIVTLEHPSIYRGIINSIETTSDNSTNKSKYPLLAAALNYSEKFLIVYRENEGIQFWQIADQMLIWQHKSIYPITKILICTDTIYLKSSSNIQIMKDPTFEKPRVNNRQEMIEEAKVPSSITIVGQDYNSLCFLGIIAGMRESPRDIYDPSIYDWVIMPYCVNILHVFAFCQDIRSIKLAFRHKCPYFRMSNELSAVSIALDLNNKELIECIVSEVASLCETDERLIYRIEPDLSRLNLASPPSLSLIYEAAYQVVKQPGIKKYGVLLKPGGMVVISPTYLIEEEKFLYDSVTAKSFKDQINLVYRVSSFRMNFSVGSREGIEFLHSLYQCTDNDVFRAKIIQDIVKYKWNSAKYFIYLYNFVFLSYVFALFTYNALTTYFSLKFDIALSAINTILLVYECLQMSVGAKGYLSSIWNLLDIFRILLTYVYATIDILYMYEIYENEKVYQSVVFGVMTLALLRGLSLFECYSRTRSIVKIFFDIIKDSRDFFLIFISATMALSFLLISLNLFTENRLITGFTTMYNMNFGGFDSTAYPGFAIFWFYIGSLVGPLIMVNLLVAIMNETFENSHENLTTRDLKALTERVIEVESVLVWRKEYGGLNYLQSCLPEVNEEIDKDKQEEKLKALAGEVEDLRERMKEIGEYCKLKNNELVARISKIRQQEISYYNQVNRDEAQFRSFIRL